VEVVSLKRAPATALFSFLQSRSIRECHAVGTVRRDNRGAMNPKKPRRTCAAGCGQEAKTAVAKYCSLRCQHDAQFGMRVRDLEAGIYPATPWNSSFLRRYLIKKLGARCSKCGWDERNPVTGNPAIEVEHIDGDWKNNRPENLTLLCPNCHALTPTYRALNRGRGRNPRLLRLRGHLLVHESRTKPIRRTVRPNAEAAECKQLEFSFCRRGSAATAAAL
jgi:hypothetical protein